MLCREVRRQAKKGSLPITVNPDQLPRGHRGGMWYAGTTGDRPRLILKKPRSAASRVLQLASARIF